MPVDTDNIFYLIIIVMPGLLAASRVTCRCTVTLLLTVSAVLVATFALLVTALWMLITVSALGLVTTALNCFLLTTSLCFLAIIA